MASTKQLLAVLKEVEDMAQMKRMSISEPGHSFAGPEADAYTANVVEATRLYRESWILEPLRIAIAALEADGERVKLEPGESAKDRWDALRPRRELKQLADSISGNW